MDDTRARLAEATGLAIDRIKLNLQFVTKGTVQSKIRRSPLNAGGLAPSWLDWQREAASRVRSHISPGPYRSFRELSLAGSVDPVTWCPPTFVGNSGIKCSNGHRGFALVFFVIGPHPSRHTPRTGIQYPAPSRSHHH